MCDVGGLDHGVEDEGGAGFALAPWELLGRLWSEFFFFRNLTAAVAAVDDERISVHAVADIFTGTAAF